MFQLCISFKGDPTLVDVLGPLPPVHQPMPFSGEEHLAKSLLCSDPELLLGYGSTREDGQL